MGGRRNNQARRVAFGGVLGALALVCMLAGGYIPVGTFTAPVFASICLVPVAIELSQKWALLCYAAVSLLSLLTVPDLELVLFFVLLLGYYPVLRAYINKLKLPAVRWLLKLILFNAVTAAVYALLLLVFASPAIIREFTGQAWWFLGGLWLMGNFIFILYDILLDAARLAYFSRIRKYLFK